MEYVYTFSPEASSKHIRRHVKYHVITRKSLIPLLSLIIVRTIRLLKSKKECVSGDLNDLKLVLNFLKVFVPTFLSSCGKKGWVIVGNANILMIKL